jgi:hypothetical protein
VNTPDEMVLQVGNAIEGMHKFGLTKEDYGALIFKKPDNSMEWQFKFLENFEERAEAVSKWYDDVYVQGKGTETLGDVYEQKMDNLREFLKEGGRADWIAKAAWYIKYHKVYYFEALIGMVWVIVVIAGWILPFTLESKEEEEETDEDKRTYY